MYRRVSTGLAAVLMAGWVLGACGSAAAPAAPGVVAAVAAENQYGSVIAQVGGDYVHVTDIMSNPNTDPHSFEASPSVAEAIDASTLVVQNGIGYDSFMNTIEAATPSSSRRVIDVGHLLGLPSDTPNPHLWYKPSTMPAVAAAVARDLETLDPSHSATFKHNLTVFDASLTPWTSAIAALKASDAGATVATTEPVGDYLLTAAGFDNLTPWTLQADIMNGVDPSPQDVAAEDALFSQHRVTLFVYNQQVTDSLTQSFLNAAISDGIPVVGVYETMPTPGFTYQSWMLAETNALHRAVADHHSTSKL